MPALDTTYLGLALRSPIVASAGPPPTRLTVASTVHSVGPYTL